MAPWFHIWVRSLNDVQLAIFRPWALWIIVGFLHMHGFWVSWYHFKENRWGFQKMYTFVYFLSIFYQLEALESQKLVKISTFWRKFQNIFHSLNYLLLSYRSLLVYVQPHICQLKYQMIFKCLDAKPPIPGNPNYNGVQKRNISDRNSFASQHKF